MEEQTLDLAARLGLKAFNHKETIATFRGERLAEALGTPLLRICAVRGIRHTPGFVEELYGLDPLFTRAVNARKIMSNIIPDMEELDEVIPYCIWYPEVATEETYRQLARRYPSMKYHVARACAVAGYTRLYSELDVLPDTHIAEEAREAGSKAIFDSIMAHPVLYSVMDDYRRRVSPDNAQPAWLNADTAVVSSLLKTQGFHAPDIIPADEPDMSLMYLLGSDGFDKRLFNITEDESIDIPT